MEFGPTSPDSPAYPSTFPKPLLRFIDRCTAFVSYLQPSDKYIVWRYTIGSASINTALIFGKISDNSKYWCYLFFKYAYNTYSEDGKFPMKLFSGFGKYGKYFNNPKLFNTEGTAEEIADIIAKYTARLQLIIMSAPRPTKDIVVFKIASKYPGLPDPNAFEPAKVLQQPFNSTTIDPHFNFALFTPKDTLGNGLPGCCFFRIVIPKNVPCMYIPKEYHAYPWENEVILPHSVYFNIVGAKLQTMNYIYPDDVNVVKVQKPEDIVVGPVYEINTYKPCKFTQCASRKKPFYVFETILSAQ